MTDSATTVSSNETHDKWWAAALSVAAAIFLTVFKLVVGLATGSLGIMAEAAHSLLDLVAAFVTFGAINISSRPADESHPYGHGKFENLSALIETLLLLLTCVWIFYEAGQRLFVRVVEVDANIWAFLVMFVSIGINIPRARQLAAIGKKYNSQALEADALHFRTDIWSSAVVVFGLVLVLIGQLSGQEQIFARADALSAIGVAIIIVYASILLGRRTVDALLDTAPPGMTSAVRARVGSVQGVQNVSNVRIRQSGAEAFVNVSVDVQRSSLFEEAHDIVTAVENAVHEVVPRADVVVDANPVVSESESVLREIRFIAARLDLAIHHLTIQAIHDKYYVALDLEIDRHLTLGEAHKSATLLEHTIRDELPSVVRVDTHIEPRALDVTLGRDITAEAGDVVAKVKESAQSVPLVQSTHNITVLRSDGHIDITMHCRVEPSLTMQEVHAASEQVIAAVRDAIPEADRILVHMEP